MISRSAILVFVLFFLLDLCFFSNLFVYWSDGTYRWGKSSVTMPSPRFILASICGAGYPNHLAELRRRWDVQGYQSNMATCSLGHVMSETREGFIDIRLLCEMRRFKSPHEHEHGVAFYMFPLAESVGCLWDGTEEMPKLFCQTATGGVEMSSLDLYRLEGKPKAVTRGAVTLTVNEGDLREELKMEPLPSTLRPPDDSDGDFILEDALRAEILGDDIVLC